MVRLFSLMIGVLSLSTIAVQEAKGQRDAHCNLNRTIRFSSRIETQEYLNVQDEYVRSLNRTEIAVAVGFQALSRNPDHRTAYMEHVSAHALDWSASHEHRVRLALCAVGYWMHEKGLRLPLPPSISLHLLEPEGMDGRAAGYTRGDGIVLNRFTLEFLPIDEIAKLVAHELVHIATRRFPRFRGAAYQAIGFQELPAPPNLPAELIERRLGDPDRGNRHVIQSVRHDGKQRWGFLIELAPKAPIQTFLSPADSSRRIERTIALFEDSNARRFVGLASVGTTSYGDEMRFNTDYLDHPDEILAEAFPLLLMNSPRPNYALMDRLREIFSQDWVGPVSRASGRPMGARARDSAARAVRDR